MRTLPFLLTSLICPMICMAQLGVQVLTTSNSAPSWQVIYENALTGKHAQFLHFGSAMECYWHQRLADSRWFLRPAWRLDRNTQEYRFHHFEATALDLQTGIGAVLAGHGSKTGNHLFVELFALGGYFNFRYRQPYFEEQSQPAGYHVHRASSFHVGAGGRLGAHLNISSQLSFGPIVGIRVLPQARWPQLREVLDAAELPAQLEQSTFTQLFMGVAIQWSFTPRDAQTHHSKSSQYSAGE